MSMHTQNGTPAHVTSKFEEGMMQHAEMPVTGDHVQGTGDVEESLAADEGAGISAS